MTTSPSTTEWNPLFSPWWRRIDRRVLLVVTVVGMLVVLGSAYYLSTLPTTTLPRTTVSGILREIIPLGSVEVSPSRQYMLWSDAGTVYTIQFAQGYFVDLLPYDGRHVQVTGILSSGPTGVECLHGNLGSTCNEVHPQIITVSSPPIIV